MAAATDCPADIVPASQIWLAAGVSAITAPLMYVPPACLHHSNLCFAAASLGAAAAVVLDAATVPLLLPHDAAAAA
jgi:hypothetical protein